MGEVGGVEGDDPGRGDLRRPPGMDVGRGEQPDPGVAVLRVVPGEERGAEGPGVLERAEASGKGRPVLERLELGLAVQSLDTWGREWLCSTPRSASRRATDLLRIDVPRSAWAVSCPGSMPSFSAVSAMRRSARTALSRVATIQPGT